MSSEELYLKLSYYIHKKSIYLEENINFRDILYFISDYSKRPSVILTTRITSYNVCYTKLLRLLLRVLFNVLRFRCEAHQDLMVLHLAKLTQNIGVSFQFDT